MWFVGGGFNWFVGVSSGLLMVRLVCCCFVWFVVVSCGLLVFRMVCWGRDGGSWGELGCIWGDSNIPT